MPGDKSTKGVLKVSLEQTVDSVMVHDIKNLAFRLTALLQNLEENYEDPRFKESMTEVLQDTIRRMREIVNRFREHGQQVMIKLRLDVNQILRTIVEGLKAKMMRNITVDLAFAELPMIWGDPFYLHDALQSVVINAVEAMPQGGVLALRTSIIRRGTKERICIEISDSGVGMSPEFMENNLFRPFMTTKNHGLGLGLFTSQQILAIHRGKVEVESTPGAGSTFRITLPVEKNGS